MKDGSAGSTNSSTSIDTACSSKTDDPSPSSPSNPTDSGKYKSKASAKVMERYNKNPDYRERQKANSLKRYYEMKALAELAKQKGLDTSNNAP